jgi:hypothetical protein
MTYKKEHWIKSSWSISIGSAIFSLLLTIGYDYSKEKPILTTVWSILNWVATLIRTILNFDLKAWWIIVAIIIFIVIIAIIDKFKKAETFKSDFYNYREDKFKRWRWTWNWNRSKNEWIISDLKAHCPNCDTPMIGHSSLFGLSYDCPRCEFRASDGECDEPHKIERIILDNIVRRIAEKKNNP